MTSFGPTPLRDDQSNRSLSLNESAFLRSCLSSSTSTKSKSQFRHDGRHITESRPIQMEFHRTHGHASTTIQFGKSTKAMASISCELVVPPNPLDRPNDGVFAFQIELSPMAKIGWESPEGSSSDQKTRISNVTDETQRLTTNRIQRCLERTILNGGVLDTEALCVTSGEWVWKIVLHVTVLEYGGNVIDAAGLASLAALRHFRLPCTQTADQGVEIVHSDDREATPLPLHYTPVFCSFALFDPNHESHTLSLSSSEKVTPLLDPNDREEMIAECPSLTFAFNKHEELCCLDFPGGVELSSKQLMHCATVAQKKAKELCSILEEALKQSNEKASQDRMERIRATDTTASLDINDAKVGVAFHETSQGITEFEKLTQDSDTIMEDALNKASKIVKQSEEEEKYRLRALDYTVGHVAAKVKDDKKHHAPLNKSNKSDKKSAGTSTLMQAMLHSASISLPPLPAQPLSSLPSADSNFAPPLIPLDVPAGYPPTKPSDLHPSLRSQKDDDEFDNFAKQTKEPSLDAVMQNLESDSDEEEQVMVLQGEFSSSTLGNTLEESKQNSNVDDDDDDDEVQDLSMAIKKKKKKKKATKSKRKT